MHVTVLVMSLIRGGVASRRHRPNHVEMKPLCGLSLEHNPQVGFGWQQGGGKVGEELEHRCLFADSILLRLQLSEPASLTCACERESVWDDLASAPCSISQSLIRSSLWATSCPWPVNPVKRTRGETLPFSAASAIPARSGGLPECQGRVTMATNQPSAMESRSTGGTCSSYDVMLVYCLKWWKWDRWKFKDIHAECP